MRIASSLGCKVRPGTRRAEILFDGDEVEEAASRLQANKEIEVAFRAGVASRSGAEHAH